jgi:hypothetical protein
VKAVKEMSVGELAAFVATHLRSKGIDVVLSGGSCVTIYTRDKYVSRDLDFVHTWYSSKRKVRETMSGLGFRDQGGVFGHPETELLIDIRPPPPAIGGERIERFAEMTFSTGTLRLLSPTDCVKDRLTWYYHDGDRQGLVQAQLVAQAHDVDLDDIERWSVREGKSEAFQQIKERLVRP